MSLPLAPKPALRRFHQARWARSPDQADVLRPGDHADVAGERGVEGVVAGVDEQRAGQRGDLGGTAHPAQRAVGGIA